jgi:hypothetical protein
MDEVYGAREEAMLASEAAFDREPSDDDWGFCAYGDAPAAIGGGVQAFHWFETKK